MLFFYNTFVFVYQLLAKLASVRSAKARAWVKGRKNIFSRLNQELIKQCAPIIWVHSASTGEFEQAKPVIEALKQLYPQHKVLATFFSPSGFEAAAGYAHIDFRYYLPIDTAANARRFVAAVQPQLVIFSKYDFWHHHIKAIRDNDVPLLLIAAVFRSNQLFFKWYGGFYRNILHRFTHLFVQDDSSLQLLHEHQIHHCSISGDTRFDRVMAISNNNTAIETVGLFAGTAPLLVAGSTWPADEALLAPLSGQFKMIIAPHEITPQHISDIQKSFPSSLLYSEAEKQKNNISSYATLIIDNVGMLSRLYRYATITYVGGGFTKDGIHNTLEAAVWGKPVIIGPNYKKYREAKELLVAGGAIVVQHTDQLQEIAARFLNDKTALMAASKASKNYVQQNAGATRRIMEYIQENRLLTR